ncbi:MAG TPA: bifunctional glutamate N-acetyltransferase/amino-acid acetyltransferase ArgJ [Gammaproteobacteria bacterium]|nr:bifunctional glutamate N-acetyltransferase/amino-acid acetyltransferase ArgJ [Gammaproteobacteria bacterium]
MAVGLKAPESLEPVSGVRLGCAALGNRVRPRNDLALIELAKGAEVAATFTRNAFRAAPVTVAEANLRAGRASYLLINAGNANAGTGSAGLDDARACCASVAELAGCEAGEVLPFSTGVVGERLDASLFPAAIQQALDDLKADGWLDAARTIVTTDTVAKGRSVEFTCGGRRCVVTGIAKGSGMIRPDMATMLAFVATDAKVSSPTLKECLRHAVDESFNRITVDGDTSTNDACVLIATGGSGEPAIESLEDADGAALAGAVGEVCTYLAQAIVRDGEGATKLVTLTVKEGKSEAECACVAYTVAHSPLVKTAMFASDPNWGRILAAVGRADIDDLNLNAVGIEIGGVKVAEGGALAAGYREEDGKRAMSAQDIDVCIRLGRGSACATVWTCDLSYDYVRINAEYRT